MEPKVAQDDIKCYKVLRRYSGENDFNSIHMDFLYEPGKEYSTDFVIYPGQGTEFGFINEGLHSFMSLLDAVNEAKDVERWVVCEFTIPVGSKYYENDKQGHYCSDRIRFDGLYHKNFWSKVKEYFRNLSIR